MRKAIFVLGEGAYDLIFGAAERDEIASMVDLFAPRQDPDVAQTNPDVLAQAEVILSGWGCPRMDEAFLAAAPNLRAVFYGAGSIKGVVTDAFWQRDIVITSSYAANAVPVAEYTLSQILFCLKRGWQAAHAVKQERKWKAPDSNPAGNFGSTVGIVSLGMIGRMVAEHLQRFDLKVIAYDPFVSPEAARNLGVELCSLDEVFRRADVVSLHAPWLKETENMITGKHFASMKPGATFINTARGAIVCEEEMIRVLGERPDLFAVLDVTWPEPPSPDSPLFTLPNVVLTPHIAGSLGAECQRMGRYATDELRRYLNGEPLHWRISRERASTMA